MLQTAAKLHLPQHMGINRDKPDRWKPDIAASVDLYNAWFMLFAPVTFRETRIRTAKAVEQALMTTQNLADLSPELLMANPGVLPMLRMATCPPIARDRLIGLAGVSKNLVESMEDEKRLRVPPRMALPDLRADLIKIAGVISRLADADICVWLGRATAPTRVEIRRAALIIADRLCGATADPIVRNEQERRQLKLIGSWLQARGYSFAAPAVRYNSMVPGTYAFRLNVPVQKLTDGGVVYQVNIPIDAAVLPLKAEPGSLPLMIEAKSAGDFTNTNKRRKEEAQKMQQLRVSHGADLRFVLFLCGYFGTDYLGYEAAEGIDWVWEHRMDDLADLGL